jgi:cytochrome c2
MPAACRKCPVLTLANILIVAGTLGAATAPALAEGDAAAGERVFARCGVCHGVGDANRAQGPNLNGVFGRVAGTQEEFAPRYSPAMKAKGEEGLVWSEETIDAYLADPRGYIPGNRMAFAGLREEADRANVIAYLKQFSEE